MATSATGAAKPPDDVGPDRIDGPAGARLASFARVAGSSIAGPDAAPWVTDFVNAAYFRRPVHEREVDDLRLANCILTSYWQRKPGQHRLRATDLRGFADAFGASRLSTAGSARDLLSRRQLLDGASVLFGPWFAEAYADDHRRGWGIAFETVAARTAYDPAARRRLARFGPLTPGSASLADQVWHTYPPVEMPSAGAVVAALTAPETWPDHATEIGRFTPLYAGGLAGQTFEIEVAAGVASGHPLFVRGYVTITKLVTPDDPVALATWFAALEDGLARYGDGAPRAVPERGEPIVGIDLTAHEGHFMGAGHDRLLLYECDGRAWVRAAGTWDPMPWQLARAYESAGHDAQHAFWGQGATAAQSMLHQLALHLDR